MITSCTMRNFEQAKQALFEGKKLRDKNWKPHKFIYVNNNVVFIDGGYLFPWFEFQDEFSYSDWEIYEEPIKPFKTQAQK